MSTKYCLASQAKLTGLVVMVAATLFAAAPLARSQSTSRVNLDPGTVIPVRLTTELSSNQSNSGDTFVARVDDSYDGYRSLMHGATVDGLVEDATPKDGNSPGTLQLKFTTLNLADGESFPINGTVTSLDGKMVKTGSNGVLEAKSAAKDHTLTYAGIGAGAGLLIGLLGNKVKIEDILLGAAAGYGVGALTKQGDVHDVDLQPGTKMGVVLGNRVSYYHRTNRNYGYERYHGISDIQPSVEQRNVKYYWYNGNKWVLDLNTGERRIVTQGNTSYQYDNGKDYTYQGHRYHLNTDTGERTQLD